MLSILSFIVTFISRSIFPIHPSIYPPFHPSIYSPIHSSIRPSIHPQNHSLNHPHIHPSINTYLLIHSFIHPYVQRNSLQLFFLPPSTHCLPLSLPLSGFSSVHVSVCICIAT